MALRRWRSAGASVVFSQRIGIDQLVSAIQCFWDAVVIVSTLSQNNSIKLNPNRFQLHLNVYERVKSALYSGFAFI